LLQFRPYTLVHRTSYVDGNLDKKPIIIFSIHAQVAKMGKQILSFITI